MGQASCLSCLLLTDRRDACPTTIKIPGQISGAKQWGLCTKKLGMRSADVNSGATQPQGPGTSAHGLDGAHTPGCLGAGQGCHEDKSYAKLAPIQQIKANADHSSAEPNHHRSGNQCVHLSPLLVAVNCWKENFAEISHHKKSRFELPMRRRVFGLLG